MISHTLNMRYNLILMLTATWIEELLQICRLSPNQNCVLLLLLDVLEQSMISTNDLLLMVWCITYYEMKNIWVRFLQLYYLIFRKYSLFPWYPKTCLNLALIYKNGSQLKAFFWWRCYPNLMANKQKICIWLKLAFWGKTP